jgi:Prp8 binding protein/COMPASS component SWD3
VWSLDYSKDGNLLVSGSPDKSVLVWDSKKSSPGIKINAHKDKVYVTRFNETGKLFASGG